MRDAIRRIVYIAFILVISLCLSSAGCKKKPAAGEKFGKVDGYVIDAVDLTPYLVQIFWQGRRPTRHSLQRLIQPDIIVLAISRLSEKLRLTQIFTSHKPKV